MRHIFITIQDIYLLHQRPGHPLLGIYVDEHLDFLLASTACRRISRGKTAQNWTPLKMLQNKLAFHSMAMHFLLGSEAKRSLWWDSQHCRTHRRSPDIFFIIIKLFYCAEGGKLWLSFPLWSKTPTQLKHNTSHPSCYRVSVAALMEDRPVECM